MSDLTILVWLWGEKYGDEYAIKFFRGIDRHLATPHRKLCMVDRKRNLPSDIEQALIEATPSMLTDGAGARVRQFDDVWQRKLGITGRIACFDIDCVTVGKLDQLFERTEPFVILWDINQVSPSRYCPCLTMLTAGYRPDIWSSYCAAVAGVEVAWPDGKAPPSVRAGITDENWYWKNLPEAGGWWPQRDGVYVFGKGGWPGSLPENARIVFCKHKQTMKQMTDQFTWAADNWT